MNNTRFVSNMVRPTEGEGEKGLDIEAGLKLAKKIRESYTDNKIMIFTGGKYIKENTEKFKDMKNVEVTQFEFVVSKFVKFK